MKKLPTTIAAAALAALAAPTPASAHHPEVAGSAACNDSGSVDVTWTISPWEARPELTWTVDVANGELPADQSFTVVRTYQPGGSAELTATGTWSNGYGGSSTGVVELPSDCTPATTVAPTTTQAPTTTTLPPTTVPPTTVPPTTVLPTVPEPTTTVAPEPEPTTTVASEPEPATTTTEPTTTVPVEVIEVDPPPAPPAPAPAGPAPEPDAGMMLPETGPNIGWIIVTGAALILCGLALTSFKNDERDEVDR